MASIKKRPNGRWRARYRDEAGKEHAKHFTRRTDAQDWLNSQTAALVRGDWVPDHTTTVEQWHREWSDGRDRNAHSIGKYLEPVAGMPLRKVTVRHMKAVVRGMEAELAASTTRRYYATMSSLFGDAVEARLLPVSPCGKSVRLPKAKKARVTIPTRVEIETVAAEMPARYELLPEFLAVTGLRIGECLGLTPEAIDWTGRTISVHQQRHAKTGDLRPVKTDAGLRTIAVPDSLLTALAAHLEQYPAHPQAIWTTSRRTPLRYPLWRHAFDPAAERAGVEWTAHDLRHFCASALIAAGCSVTDVQAHLGHASASVTLNVYSHLWPDSQDRTREALARAWADSPADSVRTGGASSQVSEGLR